MGSHRITFKKAMKTDKELVQGWLKKAHVKEYWDNSEEIWENFESYMKGHKMLFDYWICSCDKVPFGLLITSDASEPEPGLKQTPDHLGQRSILCGFLPTGTCAQS